MKYKLSDYTFYIKGIFITILILIIISYYCSKTYFNESFEDDVNVLTDTVENVNNILSNIKKKIRNQEHENELEIENFTDSEEDTDSDDTDEEEEDFTIMEHLKSKKKSKPKKKSAPKKSKKKSKPKKSKKKAKKKSKPKKGTIDENADPVLSIKKITTDTLGVVEDQTENFTSFENIAQEANNNHSKQIQGYNCGEYSDFMFGNQTRNSNKQCPIPTSNPEDYIFPGRQVNNTNKIKYASQPRVLEYENDVNEKILRYESMNVLPKYKGDSVRFQTGKLSTFKLPAHDYSTI